MGSFIDNKRFQVYFHQCCSYFILTFSFRPQFEQNCSTVLRYFSDLFSSVCVQSKAPTKLLQQKAPMKLLQQQKHLISYCSSRPHPQSCYRKPGVSIDPQAAGHFTKEGKFHWSLIQVQETTNPISQTLPKILPTTPKISSICGCKTFAYVFEFLDYYDPTLV